MWVSAYSARDLLIPSVYRSSAATGTNGDSNKPINGNAFTELVRQTRERFPKGKEYSEAKIFSVDKRDRLFDGILKASKITIKNVDLSFKETSWFQQNFAVAQIHPTLVEFLNELKEGDNIIETSTTGDDVVYDWGEDDDFKGFCRFMLIANLRPRDIISHEWYKQLNDDEKLFIIKLEERTENVKKLLSYVKKFEMKTGEPTDNAFYQILLFNQSPYIFIDTPENEHGRKDFYKIQFKINPKKVPIMVLIQDFETVLFNLSRIQEPDALTALSDKELYSLKNRKKIGKKDYEILYSMDDKVFYIDDVIKEEKRRSGMATSSHS